jgi:hypothetical protein
MSHIFISYSRKDTSQLNKVLTWLAEQKFVENEIWHDQSIEAGNNWHDEIFEALDSAFAVVVIVTNNLVDSKFCTIEWAYGLGQGIPVLPLLFEEVSITDMPAPLAAKQIINCLDNVPDSLSDRLRRLKSVPPEVSAVNRMIYELTYDTHRRFFILQWLGKELFDLGSSDYLNKDVLRYFMEAATQAKAGLEKVMLENAFALNGKQHRLAWQLVDCLKEISRIQVEHAEWLPQNVAHEFETKWLPAFYFFDGYGWWQRGMKTEFEQNLEDVEARMPIVVEMTRVFPMLTALDADILIQNKNVDVKRTTK